MRKELDSCTGVKCDKVALRPSGTLLDDNGIFLFRVKLAIYFFKRDPVVHMQLNHKVGRCGCWFQMLSSVSLSS